MDPKTCVHIGTLQISRTTEVGEIERETERERERAVWRMGRDHDWGAGHISARQLLLQSQFVPDPWMQYFLHRRCGIRNLHFSVSSTDAVSKQQATVFFRADIILRG